MGASYVNYTVKGADQKSVLSALAGRKALVSPAQNGMVVACDQESDQQDQKVIGRLATRLSNHLQCTVFAVLLYDSDILWYQLYEDGKLSDQYNSAPYYWSFRPEPSPPQGGNAARLCTAFGSGKVETVERILHATVKIYADAMNRHADLVDELDLPRFAVGYGFEGATQGYLPKGLSVGDLLASNS